MNWYLAKFKLESWVASAWQADTIWGHLCWGLKYLYGEDALLEFIAAYDQGKPPLLVSNGFPGDLLPRPIVPEPPIDSALTLNDQREAFRERKKAKASRFIIAAEFGRALKGEWFVPQLQAPYEERSVTLKNQIDRLTGTTGAGEGNEGHLFNFEQYHWDTVSIYVKVAEDFVETARELFGYIEQTGYGKRKSVGYGQVKLVKFDPFPGFSDPPDANGFVSLSDFVPAVDDPVDGYWDVLVKYGKLGEEFANEGNPFKKPLVMLTAGAAFYDTPCRPYYGRLILGLSAVLPDKVVQYGLALPVPMKLPVREAEG